MSDDAVPEAPSPRTTVRRKRDRADYDPTTVEAILDEGLVCHLGVVVDGAPVVIPTLHARSGRTLYLHGAPGNAALRTAATDGAQVCATVTLIDGLVLARSAFHHSANYRSAVVFGAARKVEDTEEKEAALAALVEHIVPGRDEGTRAPSAEELRSTLVIALPIEEASAKVRTGPPIDEPEDHDLGHWAGVLPLTVVPGEPQPDPLLPEGTAVPDHVRSWRPRR
ncbi:MAG: pyridoxamine 5'-phosphate oxidase family protein [Acidimicrobiia bacterium]|nr:pyridoxamine 5'-phosphate oxidase family protein [Acidimicrobiia bacterium]